jgi:hypothetical protein
MCVGTPTYHHISVRISFTATFPSEHPSSQHSPIWRLLEPRSLNLQSLLCALVRQHALHITEALFRSCYRRLADYTALLRTSASETNPASHAYHICLLANGRSGLWRAIRKKRWHSDQPSIQSEGVICLLHFKKEEASRRANLPKHSKE